MSVCLNHTDRPAPNRCKSCLKPFCNECATQGDDGIYCSLECIENTKKFRERLQAMGPIKGPPSAFDVLRGPILFLVALVFAVMLFWALVPASAPVAVRSFILHNLYHEQPHKAHSKHK